MKAVGSAIFGSLLLFVCTTMAAREFPPGRVARLQYINGSVSIQPQGTQDWVPGAVNRALTTSDNVWTDKNSRAELGVGTGVLRMNGETSLTLTNISMGTVQVTLHQGTLNLRVFHLFGGEFYEVDTPNVVFTVRKSGEYRFDVDSGGDTTLVTVWKGEGNATGEGPAVRVRSHEQARFTGTMLTRNIHPAPRPDGFDNWCQVRNERSQHALYGPYVAPGVVGYPPPYVYPAPYPYGYGPWVWVAPWGWVRR